MIKIEKEIKGKKIILETGRVAKKSDGAVLVQYEDTIVLVTAVISLFTSKESSFLPLTVDYREKAYAVGKIPGGFFKREGRPSDEEILCSRLIDRSIRPLFPEGFRNEVQIIATVLSAVESNRPSTLSIIGAAAALSISGFSLVKPIAGVRIGKVGEEFLFNPTDEELKQSELNFVIAGSKEGIVMVEGEANKVEEEVVIQSFKEAHSYITKLIEVEEEFISKAKKKEKEVPLYQIEEELKEKVTSYAKDKIEAIKKEWSKEEKDNYVKCLKEEVLEKFLSEYTDKKDTILDILEEMLKKRMRELIIKDGERWDKRGMDEVRPISCEVGVLPRVHGSAIFTRGETQALVVTTLGTSADEQRIDGLQKEEVFKKFMFHYNFPPFSTGEVKYLRGPGRREIGHGFLAEKALLPVLPDDKSFPYTIRLVSDILESNGSSSMASVCGGSLSLMDAGVSISDPVAGVAMGLVKEGGKVVILTDIQGLEDHFGDMDFKIAGIKEGITAIQLDIKISEIDFDILKEALNKAKIARSHILQEMEKVIKEPRGKLSSYAPHIAIVSILPDKIGELIGPGGRIIKRIIKESGADINIDDVESKVTISSPDEEKTEKALQMVKQIISEPEVGKIYSGKVKRVTDFGAFVEIMPGKEGLVHVSEMSNKFVKNVSDVVKVGDAIKVKLVEIDELGRLNLSKRKAMLHSNDSSKKTDR
ncbi:polyribonucleotide nucleotidyltransferase [Candidatus Aerophobetes bacterium]|nr:polyribonucleotide nucleotidyltransferase [Candidatus Aerophobetes bacterium]